MSSDQKKHAFRALDIAPRIGSGYPPPFNAGSPCRAKRAVGNPAGLTQFGVNLTVLPPGEQSALRHWHTHEDEFVYVLSGELVLITGDGEETMTAGSCAGFPAGVDNGHHLVNRSDADATFLEIGSRADDDEGIYPDVDLHASKIDGVYRFTKKNGEPA